MPLPGACPVQPAAPRRQARPPERDGSGGRRAGAATTLGSWWSSGGRPAGVLPLREGARVTRRARHRPSRRRIAILEQHVETIGSCRTVLRTWEDGSGGVRRRLYIEHSCLGGRNHVPLHLPSMASHLARSVTPTAADSPAFSLLVDGRRLSAGTPCCPQALAANRQQRCSRSTCRLPDREKRRPAPASHALLGAAVRGLDPAARSGRSGVRSGNDRRGSRRPRRRPCGSSSRRRDVAATPASARRGDDRPHFPAGAADRPGVVKEQQHLGDWRFEYWRLEEYANRSRRQSCVGHRRTVCCTDLVRPPVVDGDGPPVCACCTWANGSSSPQGLS